MASPNPGPWSRAPDVGSTRVTVVVASGNRRDELLHGPGWHRAPVVLVDDGSTDGTVAAVRERYPWEERLARDLTGAGWPPAYLDTAVVTPAVVTPASVSTPSVPNHAGDAS